MKELVSVQEVWVASGGNPEVEVTREELLSSLDSLRRALEAKTASNDTLVDTGTSVAACARKSFTDAQCLDWLERHHTLHKTIAFLYVVDGYKVSVCWDDEPFAGPFYGETLRDALAEAMQNGDIKTPHGR